MKSRNDIEDDAGYKRLAEDENSEIERLRMALLRVARFSHAKDFSHHGVGFERCDKGSCVDARADLEPRVIESSKRKSKKIQVEEALRRSDLSAQLSGRDNIEYGPHDCLPRGEHVARLSKQGG